MPRAMISIIELQIAKNEKEEEKRKNIKFNKSKYIEHNRKNRTNIENLSRN